MNEPAIESAVASVPVGAWGVGVSGGADSVALLAALRQRADLRLHVVHLDHQTRGEASTGDARFVRELCDRWSIPCTSMRRDQVEPSLDHLPANPSAKYRMLRLELFRRIVQSERLEGMILAHHADDQAETVLQRLIRGSSYAGLAGMRNRAVVRGLTILRPLVNLRRDDLRRWLTDRGLTWREDASNASDAYLRNRLRRMIGESDVLFHALIEMSGACGELRDWVRSSAPVLSERISAAELSRLPMILAEQSAKRWLQDGGVPAEQIDAGTIDRLLMMVSDAATPARQEFPGPVTVRRRRGVVSFERKDV